MSIHPPQETEGSAKEFFGVPDELNAAVAVRLDGALPSLAAIQTLAMVESRPIAQSF